MSYVPITGRRDGGYTPVSRKSTYTPIIGRRPTPQQRAYQFERIATPTLQQVRRATFSAPQKSSPKGAEIREAPKTLDKKIRDILPRKIEEKVYEPIRRGLFGDRRDLGQGPQNMVSEMQNKGLVGFLAPPLTRTHSERIDERYTALRSAGISEQRALDVATRHASPFADKKDFTDKEKKALRGVRIMEGVDVGIMALDVASLGTAKPVTRAGRNAIEKVVTKGTKPPITTELTPLERLREIAEDDFIRVRRLQKQPGVVVREGANPDMAERLMHGSIHGARELNKQRGQALIDETRQLSKTINVPEKKLIQDIDDYLVARHTPERIARLGEDATPFTARQAAEIVKRIEASPHAKAIQRIAADIKKINDDALKMLKDNEIITNKLYNTLRTRYKEHVPLYRVFDEAGNVDLRGLLSARGTSVTSTGIKTAKGSQREVSDILSNALFNYDQAVIRSERNAFARELKRFVDNNPELSHLFKEVRPPAIGKNWKGGTLFGKIDDPQVLQFYVKGKKQYLRIEDKSLASTLQMVNRQKWPAILTFIPKFSRLMSALATQYNPAFAFSNKVRDLQEAIVYAASAGQGAKATKIAAKDPASMKAITDFLRGKDTEGARLYKQMKADGGTTGRFGMSAREIMELDVTKMRELHKNKPKQAALKIMQYLENWNTIFEDSTRLSVYRNALENGMSRRQAAEMAKVSTVNFNKMGTGGPIINGLYMFSNASIQGSVKMLRAFKNPKVALATTMAVGSAVLAANNWNDKVDPEWRNKIRSWDRINNLVIAVPSKDGSFKYITIPVSWGIKPIKVTTETLFDKVGGEDVDVRQAVGNIFASVIEGYNPIGGSDLMSAITPTILDLPVDIARNKAWHGGTIKPDWDKYAPASTQYYSGLRDTIAGRMFISASRQLADKKIMEVSPADIHYAYTTLIGGTGRLVSGMVDTGARATKGEFEPAQTPFINRFYRSIDEEQIGAGTADAKIVQGLLTEQSRTRFYARQEAEDIYTYLKEQPIEQQKQDFADLRSTDPETARRVLEIRKQEEKGLNYSDRLVLSLGVENGERAKFIYQKLMSLPEEEQQELWREYRAKGILSDNVARQVLRLRDK